jgi:hypothetical protein
MKIIVDDKTPEGLEAFLGQVTTFWCVNYIYTGKLVGVNDKFVKLEDASVVYETGELTSKTWQNVQKVPNDWYLMVSAIESFGVMK